MQKIGRNSTGRHGWRSCKGSLAQWPAKYIGYEAVYFSGKMRYNRSARSNKYLRIAHDEVRNTYITTQHLPASTAVEVQPLFRDELLIEVDAIAVIPI
jgi:hypothetical protein